MTSKPKFKEDRPFADPEVAARELLRIYRKFIAERSYKDEYTYTGVTNGEFIYRRGGSPAEYSAGVAYGTERGWFEIWGGGTRVRVFDSAPE